MLVDDSSIDLILKYSVKRHFFLVRVDFYLFPLAKDKVTSAVLSRGGRRERQSRGQGVTAEPETVQVSVR